MNEDYFMNDAYGTAGYNPAQYDYNPLGNAGYAIDPMTQTNNGGLLGNIGNYMGGFGDLTKGLAGIYGMYLGNRAQKDTEKNNSLYRRLMDKEDQYRTKFRNDVQSAFA